MGVSGAYSSARNSPLKQTKVLCAVWDAKLSAAAQGLLLLLLLLLLSLLLFLLLLLLLESLLLQFLLLLPLNGASPVKHHHMFGLKRCVLVG